MRPRRFHGANKVFRKPGGNEDTDLWVRQDTGVDEELGDVTQITSVWELTDDERAAIAAGGNVELMIIGAMQPPVALDVTDVPLGAGA